MGKKKDVRIQELMKKPGNIRNLGIIAHIDHGKCVSGESRVALFNGVNKTARGLFNQSREEGDVLKHTEEELVLDVSGQDLFVNSFNTERGVVEKGRISKVWRLKKTNPLVEINTHNGSSIKTTPEHEFLVLSEEGEFVYKRADKVNKGEHIVCVRKLLYNALTFKELKKEFLTRLSRDEGFYVKVSESLNKRVSNSIREEGIKSFFKRNEILVGYKALVDSLKQGRYRVKDLVTISEYLNLDLTRVYDNVKRVNYRGLKSKGVHSSVWLTLPKREDDFNKLYYILGVCFGDGTGSGKVFNTNKEFMEHVQTLFNQVFSYNPSIMDYESKKGCYVLETGVLTFSKLLNTVFDFPEKDKSNRLSVQEVLSKSSKSLIKPFIRGCFDTDGTVEKSRSAVSICSASSEFLKGLQSLFYKLDIGSKYNSKKRSLYISGRNALTNFKNVGFWMDGKDERFKKLLNKSGVAKIDWVPVGKDLIADMRRKLGLSLTESYASGYEYANIGLSKYSLKKISENFRKHTTVEELRVFDKLTAFDTVFSEVVSKSRDDSEEFVYDFTVEDYHNFISEGIVVHNSTLSDSLLAGAGLLSTKVAGKAKATDTIEEEQERGITIMSSAVTMVHEHADDYHLINLIDTPGHVDFGGEVTRALRAVDGALVLVCAVEGVMPQTETVLKQAIKERVKPVLFINKVDRLIKELKISPKEMQERFINTINEVNKMIKELAPKKYKEEWQVKVQDGSVAFGSAYHKWALSMHSMKKKNITFKEIIDAYHGTDEEIKEQVEELAEKAPLHGVVLDMTIRHLPDPKTAQSYRVPHIWRGDVESEVGESLTNCNPNGQTVFVVTNVKTDPTFGELVFGRVFSGTLKAGQEVYLSRKEEKQKAQRLFIMVCDKRTSLDEIPVGNTAAIIGVKGATSGETLSEEEITPFEDIKHIFEPVVTRAIEAENPADLPKLINVLRDVSKEDPTIKVQIDEETGEHLLSGLGELHLEDVIDRRIIKERGLDVKTSPPIVVYRESINKPSTHMVEGKSPNKHNKFYIKLEPLKRKVKKAIMIGEIPEQRVNKRDRRAWKELHEMGMPKEEAKNVRDVYKGNVFIDETKGEVHLVEIMDTVLDAFENVMDEGPLSREPVEGVKVYLEDVKLHEDSIHRGPAQVIPAVRDATKQCFKMAEPIIKEPVQEIRIDAPNQYLGNISKLIGGRRGQLLDTQYKKNDLVVLAKIPVAESFGFTSDLRSITEGRGVWSLKDSRFEQIPPKLQDDVIEKIRNRKGLSENQ